MSVGSDNCQPFREALLDWYRGHRRDYPWRRTTDPWAILISEMMLQQTQVATVLERGYFTRWLERFPTPADLAEAPEQEVLSMWEGLGYYNRARNLQRAAIVICDQHAGKFPTKLDEIEALPGIGRYTAAAVYSFAYDKPAPLVDANVARVIARLNYYALRIDTSAGQKFLWDSADQILDRQHPRDFNSAIMELGQAICTARAPKCVHCPVGDWCSAYQSGHDASSLPIKKPKRETVLLDEHALLVTKGSQILLHHESGTRRKGFWKLPLRSEAEVADREEIYRSTYGITHHRVSLYIYRSEGSELRTGDSWHSITDLAKLPIASPFRKALDSLLS